MGVFIPGPRQRELMRFLVLSRSRSVVDRQSHNLEATGSTPVCAIFRHTPRRQFRETHNTITPTGGNVFPASSGVIRTLRARATDGIGIPRQLGGDPARTDYGGVAVRYSPPARG